MKNTPFVFVILDGWGIAPAWGGNAISLAQTPFFDYVGKTFPSAVLAASGEAVGLPGHERGNSEVGHLNLGAGRVVRQDNTRIDAAIKDGSFFASSVLRDAIAHCRGHNSKLHLMGLVSDGNIHSELAHLFALLELAGREHFEQVFIHVFTDGRDTAPMSALLYLEQLEGKLKEFGFGTIATVTGRFYAMDRDNHWERTERAYRALTEGIGVRASSARQAIALSYQKEQSDEFIEPSVIVKEDAPVALVGAKDALVFFNFRADRARQLTQAFLTEDFTNFARPRRLSELYFATMIPYGAEQEFSIKNAHPILEIADIADTFAAQISRAGLKQLHIAETEKYAHVTYFLNGGREDPYPSEDRLLIPSPRVSRYDTRPEMAAAKITAAILEACRKNKYDIILVNFANADMIGHTGNFSAAIRAVEVLDNALAKIWEALRGKGGTLLITADHGNIEQMVNPRTGEPDTEHTQNPVPLYILREEYLKFPQKLTSRGVLADVAPTALALLGIAKPAAMSGTSLLVEQGGPVA